MENEARERQLKALRRAISILGGQVKVANILGVKQGHVSAWLNRFRIPPTKILAIEKATLTAGELITRHDLDCEIYPMEDSNHVNQAAA